MVSYYRARWTGVAWKTFFLVAFFALTVQDVWSQGARVPEFSVDLVSVRSDTAPAKARVDVYTRISYTRLSFINTPTGFTANYEITLSAIEVNDDDRLRNLVQTRIWDASVVVNTYAETQAEDYSDFTTQSLELDPGMYVFEFEIADNNSSQVFVREVAFAVRDFVGGASISDITLLKSYDEETLSIVPRVDQFVGTDEGGFQIFYEIYSDNDRFITVKREVIRTVKDGGLPVSSWFMKAVPNEGAGGDTVFLDEESITLTTGKTQNIVTIPIDDLKVGAYLMRVSLIGRDGSILDMAERRLAALWTGLNAHINNLDDAIAQLEYIAPKKDLKFIRDAENQVERYQRFRNFWKKRDPTPGTRRNERMEEYYYRVDSANRQYGAVQDGWKTDRGFVFVRFGEPDHIERRPHSFDYEPYEIWVYQRIGRQYIFIDKTGFGDFQLLVPVWDERTRLY